MQETLRQLRALPQLTALQIVLPTHAHAVALLDGLTPNTAVAALQAVLPLQLRFFSLALENWVGVWFSDRQRDLTRLLFSSLLSAVAVMRQLTELDVRCESYGTPLIARFDALAQLPHLRKLSLFDIVLTDEWIAELKQLSQLRELRTLLSHRELIRLCQPPHALQLEYIDLHDILVDESEMRAVLHLPTLTKLQPKYLRSAAWPLLPGLPLLRRVTIPIGPPLTAERTTLLSTTFSDCRALTELVLNNVDFRDDHGCEAIIEQQTARWTELLASVPQLQRFEVQTEHIPPLLAVLPEHLPQLVFLKLIIFQRSHRRAEELLRLAHPMVQELELKS
jgi:hypothetical protein